ncbi:hypothetical protein K6C39_22945, partial [Vibrio vulnificus]|nr:hypothetical protein [Vibrio vulnificus]
TIGLIHAIDRFDLGRGVQFPTFAMPTIVGEIRRYFRDSVRSVHVPRRLHEMWAQVRGATEELTVALGRDPNPAEIAERLGGMGVERLKEVTEGRLRVAALEDGGYRTVGSVWAATVGELQLVPGVGALTAGQALAAARQIGQAVERTVTVWLDVDEPDARTTALVVALHRL